MKSELERLKALVIIKYKTKNNVQHSKYFSFLKNEYAARLFTCCQLSFKTFQKNPNVRETKLNSVIDAL